MSQSVMKAAGVMGAATFMSRILGLVREQVFAILFGAGLATDAFNIAFRIPNLLRDLFAEGAMSAAFVPTFIRARKERGDRAAWRVAGLVFRVLFYGVCGIAIVGMIWTEPLVSIYAGAFRSTPGKFELTVLLTRLLFPFLPLVALAAAFMGVLNACGAYFIPAFSSALFNLVSIVTGVVGVWICRIYGVEPIVGMAVGVLFGGAVQAFSQLPLLYRKGYQFSPRSAGEPSWMEDPSLKNMLILMVPGTMGLAATQVNILVNSVLATGQGTGAVSWLNYAFRFMQFPIGIFGVSLASATLPAVSRHWVDGRVDDFAGEILKSLKMVFAVNLPAAAGLAFLGAPIIQLIFEYGRFSHADTIATGQALAAYAVGLAFYSGVKVLVPVFYAMNNTRVPVISSALSVGINLLGSWILVRTFGFWGLALGTSITAGLNFFFLLFALDRELISRGLKNGFATSVLMRHLISGVVLSLSMGAIVWMSHFVFETSMANWSGPVILFRALRIGLVIALGIAAVYGLARIFRMTDTIEMYSWVIRRVRSKLKERK